MTAASAIKCTRFPCDHAYRRGSHLPAQDGTVECRTGWGSGDWDPEAESYPWKVYAAAREGFEWSVGITVGTVAVELTNDEVSRLIQGLTRALITAHTANRAEDVE